MICTTPPFRSLGGHALHFLVDLTEQRVPIRGEERSDVLQIDRTAGGEIEQDQIAGERDRNDDATPVQRFRALEDLQLPFPFRQQDVRLHSLGEGDAPGSCAGSRARRPHDRRSARRARRAKRGGATRRR